MYCTWLHLAIKPLFNRCFWELIFFLFSTFIWPIDAIPGKTAYTSPFILWPDLAGSLSSLLSKAPGVTYCSFWNWSPLSSNFSSLTKSLCLNTNPVLRQSLYHPSIIPHILQDLCIIPSSPPLVVRSTNQGTEGMLNLMFLCNRIFTTSRKACYTIS